MKRSATLLISTTVALLMALPAFAERGQRIVQRLDTNGDGKISFDEFQAPGPRAQERLERADTNGDGMVTLDEMNAMMAQRMEQMKQGMEKRHAEMQQKMQERFKQMDANGDGALSADEMRHGAFSQMDKNGDGYLTADEFRPHRMHRPGMHRKGMGGMPGPDDMPESGQ